jgi:hypothetical protein
MSDSDDVTGTADVDVQVDVNPLAHVIAPIVAIGATMLVRKWMNSGYKRVAKGPVPTAGDPRVSLGRALMWSAITAATAAVVEVAVFRIANHLGERKPSA